MFLTADHLIALTDREQSARQIDWLRENGYPFDVSAAGYPKVLVSYVQKRLGGDSQQTVVGGTQPNLAFLHKKRR